MVSGLASLKTLLIYLNSQDLEWVIRLKQSGVVDKIGIAEGSDNQSSKEIV